MATDATPLPSPDSGRQRRSASELFEITATRAGRRIEVTTGRGVVEVAEVTRTGNPVRSGRFMANRVVALVEHLAKEGEGGVDETTRRLPGSSTA